MNDEDRTIHKFKLLHSLEASLRLMPLTTKEGGVFLLDVGRRGAEKMHLDGLFTATELVVWKQKVVDAFVLAHPHLDPQAQSPQLDDLDAQVLSGDQDELVKLARRALGEFRDKGLETQQ